MPKEVADNLCGDDLPENEVMESRRCLRQRKRSEEVKLSQGAQYLPNHRKRHQTFAFTR